MQKSINTIIRIFARYKDRLGIGVFVCIVAAFFYQTLFFGKLPVPTDALVGMYHPYRDVYSKDYPNGIPFKNFLITDPVRQQIPWRKTVIDSFKNGKLPLWDAYSFSGTPLLANIQTGALYPFNILFFFLPFSWAWAFIIMSQPLLSGVFLYLFLRNKKLDMLPSLFGAVTSSFSGFSISWLTWGTIGSTWAWMPLSLLAIDKVHDFGIQNKRKWRILLIVSIAFSFFAGHLQIFFYSLSCIALYTVYVNWHLRKQVFQKMHGIIGIGILIITSPLWVRMLSWLPGTSRVTGGALWQHEGFFIPIQHLIQFLVPDFFGNPTTLNYWGVWNYGEMVGYVGIAGIIFVFFGISAATLFWTICAGGALIFAVASPVSLLPYQWHIPLVDSLQPTRLMMLVDLSLSVLGAYGMSYFLKDTKKRKIALSLVIIAGIFAVIWISVVWLGHTLGISTENSLVAKRNLVFPVILFVCTSIVLVSTSLQKIFRKSIRPILCIAIIFCVVIDLFRFGWKFIPFTDSAYFFPQTNLLSYLQNQPKPFRIAALDDRILPPNVNEYYGIESIAGYDPIHNARYEQFIAAMERGKPDIQPPYGFERIITPKNISSPLFNLLNVKYVLSFDEQKNPAFEKVFEEGLTKIYENVNFIPRVYLAAEIYYRNNPQEIFDMLYDPLFHPGNDAIVETPVSLINLPLSTAEVARITAYSDSSMRVDVQTQVPRLLVIHETYDRGWRVTVDNTSLPLIRVNYIFSGVILQPGTHSVSLVYR